MLLEQGQSAQHCDLPPKWLIPSRYSSLEHAFEERQRIARDVGPLLERVLSERDKEASIDRDPVSFVHRYADPQDQELVALVASSLAYGNIKVILASIQRALVVLGESPTSFLDSTSCYDLNVALEAFVHRFTRGPDLASLIWGARVCQRLHGGLGTLFSSCFCAANGDLREAVFSFVNEMRRQTISACTREDAVSRGLSYLLPDGTGSGACKRLNMFLRWMVRGPDQVDLGLWEDLSPSILLMPLDTHTGRISRYLGFTTRKDQSWRTAEEVTWHLQGISPDDPVRYDFALAHLGISRECSHTGIGPGCDSCSLRNACGICQNAC